VSDSFRRRDCRLSVLVYHHVGPVRASTFTNLTIMPEQFQQQVCWLKQNGYTGIRPRDWVASISQPEKLPRKPVILTFDDAYADITESALPILEKEGFPSAVFVVTDLIGKTNQWDQRLGSAPHQLMNADQIRYWAQRGVELGAHTCSHPDLTAPDVQIDVEVTRSRDDLADLLGASVISFVYPFGHHNEAIRAIVRQRFQIAFTTEDGINTLHTDLHALRRTMVQPHDSLSDFALRVRLGWNPMEHAKGYLRRSLRAFISAKP
jgi:peptidoglycan/xylan/chitin deacetylase (PgdA/CDA1 family)